MRPTSPLLLLTGALAAAALPVFAAPAKPKARPAAARPADPAVAPVNAAVQRGLAYLRKTQSADGSWMKIPGATALGVLAFVDNGAPRTDPTVARAYHYLLSQQKPDGAIYTTEFGPAQELPNYNTALSLSALAHAHDPSLASAIRKAQAYLSQSQLDEGEGYKPADRQYGGIGYGRRPDRPDLSNLQTALEGLADSGMPKNADVFKKALLFLQRVQNRSESNDQQWAGSDGGFVYGSDGSSPADEFTKAAHSSYGSMTYAGLKSYLYCSVTKTDPRVQAAWGWLRSNWNVNENPRMGEAGVYYYYHTMAKTLSVWGDKLVSDAAGQKHRWGPELGQAIAARQGADGSWSNKNPRWLEDKPDLATAYALVSLSYCKHAF